MLFPALMRALRDLFRLKVLWIIVWPMLAAMLLWAALGYAFWDTLSVWIASGLEYLGIQHWLDGIEPRWVANALQVVLHLILFVPLVYVTALFITAFFAMPTLIKLVADKDYPQLARQQGGGLIGNLANAATALFIFLLIWALVVPLWFIGASIVIPFIATAYLNQRLFRYDALAEHASLTEMQVLFEKHRFSWWSLGLLTGLLQFVPILNLLAPVLTALAFIHFGLDRLNKLRQGNAKNL